MTNTITPTRNEIRQLIRKRRNNLSSIQQNDESLSLVKTLEQHSKTKAGQNIAIYLANDGELNTLPLIHYCWDHGIKTYLPVLHPFSKGNLLFLHYHQQTKMVTNKYGILEPTLNVNDVMPVMQLDIIFTPLVAFDINGARLGMGGGYYDRTLANWYKHHKTINKPYPIGLAHNCQLVEKLPTEKWDVPIPEIVTPKKVYQFY